MNDTRIRRLLFGPRSALPSSAACVVANGVRETLASLLGLSVEVSLSEPALPSAAAWSEIVRDALLYRVSGTVADAAIVLRCPDALSVIGALFGEPAQSQRRELSPIENDVMDRTVCAVAAHLGAVCGAGETHPVERVMSFGSFSTYFEIFIEAPLCARIGIALSRDPAPAPHERFEIGDLACVPLRLHATMDIGGLRGGEAAALRPGKLLALSASRMQQCSLQAGRRRLLRGSCGVRNGHYAITVAAL